MLPPGVNAPGTAAPGDVLTPKKQAVVDRLRRRIESYRRRQTDFMPRFGQSFNGFCEQNIQETLLLKQKFLENKSKRAAKKQEKKQPDQVNNLIAQQKFLKRPAEEDGGEYGETGAKLPCGVGGSSGGNAGSGTAAGGTARPTEALTKFSVEIVQQLEFTTSAANSQPQQISTNVTVKALTNASVKSSEEPVRAPAQPPPSPVPLVECKREPDSEFVDLEQCAAALEKDAQNNGSFPGFSELIGNEGSDEIITSDAFKDLISEISDFHPEFMKDFDFGENMVMKVEVDSKEGIVQHQGYQQYESNAIKARIPPYPGLEFGKGEMSPAAQTLKQMAEQHQHKTQLGMGFPAGRTPRSPYTDYQFPQGELKNQSTNTGQTEVKQEVTFSASQSQSFQAGIRSPGGPKTPTNMMGGYKQQYSPYSSPGGHSSPGYMPRGQGPGAAPPRPPSDPGPTLQMSQNQQMHINQQSPGPQIQVSAGQHMQLNSELKGNVSLAAQQQQGMYFAPSNTENSYNLSQSQTINFTQQSLRQRGPPEQLLRTGLRPPPPDYKAPPQQQQQQQQQPPLMHSMGQPRFPQASVRRPGPGQQPMPPSGPMMRPQMAPSGAVYMGGSGLPRGLPPGAGYLPRHRPPNVNMGAEGMSMGPGRGPEGMSMGPGRMPDGMQMGSARVPDVMSMGRGPEGMTMGPGRGPESMGMGPGRVPDGMSMRGPEGMQIGPGRGPDSMGMGRERAEWRHVVMSQQQSAAFSAHGRTFSSHPGNFSLGNNPGGMQQMHPQVRNQMGMMPQMMQSHVSSANQMSMNLQMSQSQSMSVGGGMNVNNSHGGHAGHVGNALQFHHMHSNSFPNIQGDGGGHSQQNMSNGMNNSLHGGDLGLEFLDTLSSDPQDLFGGLDSPSNFNINDIL